MVYIDKCIRENPEGPEGVIMAEYHNNVRFCFLVQKFYFEQH